MILLPQITIINSSSCSNPIKRSFTRNYSVLTLQHNSMPLLNHFSKNTCRPRLIIRVRPPILLHYRKYVITYSIYHTVFNCPHIKDCYTYYQVMSIIYLYTTSPNLRKSLQAQVYQLYENIGNFSNLLNKDDFVAFTNRYFQAFHDLITKDDYTEEFYHDHHLTT